MSCYEPFHFGNELKDAHLSKIYQSPIMMNVLMNWCKDPKYFLFFNGNVGTGKSYFCASFYNQLKESNKICRVYSEQHFFNDLKYEIQTNSNATARIRTICETEYVIFDDLGSSSMTEWQKEMLVEFIDLRYQSGYPTLITSNLTEQEVLFTLGKRTHSRIFAARNYKIHNSSEDRRQIL